MAVRVRDLLDEGITVQVRCTGCGRTLVYQGPTRLRYLGQMNKRIRDIQRKLKCARCGSRGELVMTIPCFLIDKERKTHNPISATSQAGPPLWRWL